MKITTDATSMKIKRSFEITEDHPVVAMAYSRPPKEVRIERGNIEYTWKDGEWVVESSWSVSVVGTVLKKDGTDSKNTHARHAPHRYDPTDEGWPWLDKIIDLLQPAGGIIYASFEAPFLIGDVLG